MAGANVRLRTASSRVNASTSRTQWASRCVCNELSMIWLTWAPESENVTSARGCFMIDSRCSGSRLAMTWTKNCSKFGLQREVDHHVDGILASSAARSATVGLGGTGCSRMRIQS